MLTRGAFEPLVQRISNMRGGAGWVNTLPPIKSHGPIFFVLLPGQVN